MSMFDDDLDTMFADAVLTVPVTYGAQSTRGFLSTEDVLESDNAGGVVTVQRRVVAIRDTALTGLQNDRAITVDGVTLRIHDRRVSGHGQLKVVLA